MEIKFSEVERHFIKKAGDYQMSTKLPYILVENFPRLGLMTALRFLEWVLDNPEGVISLPTGKTPEYFIRYTEFLLNNWNKKKGEEITVKIKHSEKEVLPSPSGVVLDKAFEIMRAILHIEEDKGEMDFSLGLRSGEVNVIVKIARKDK